MGSRSPVFLHFSRVELSWVYLLFLELPLARLVRTIRLRLFFTFRLPSAAHSFFSVFIPSDDLNFSPWLIAPPSAFFAWFERIGV